MRQWGALDTFDPYVLHQYIRLPFRSSGEGAFLLCPV